MGLDPRLLRGPGEALEHGKHLMTVALTGGTGFIGGHLRSALHEEPVVLLGRRKPGLLDNERWCRTDMTHPISPEDLANVETLCHLAFSMEDLQANIRHNRHLLDAVNVCPNIRRVVLMSTTSVYGAAEGLVLDEESPCNPVGEYARVKLECEALWREGLREGCALVVLRPSEVIGPGGKGLLALIEDALRRPVLGAARRSLLYHRPLHYVAVSNVVAAVVFLLGLPQASARELYVVSGDDQPENRSYAAMQDAIREARGYRPLPGLGMPRWTLRALEKATGRKLATDRKFTSRKLRAAGFEDALPLREEVRRVVRHVVDGPVGASS